MPLSKEQITSVEATIRESLRKKFQNYKRESKNMPFHYRLLGQDRMALYSFIQSLNTTFGISIFEPVAETLAKTRFVNVQSQYEVGNEISEDAQNEIQHIMNKLTTGDTDPDKREEIQRIGAVCQKGQMNRLQTVRADLLVENDEGSLFLFDLKTVKPNKGDFEKFKKTLLDWCAIALAKTPDLDIHSLIAIPYNPYEPGPYKRWTAKGMLDLGQELKVADEFWDFLGGDGAYQDLLDCFERIGIELRPEIDLYFERFRN